MPLTNEETKRSIVGRGKRLYEEKLKSLLELAHKGEFLAIEPESARYFLGKTRSEVIAEAIVAMPNDVFYLRRVGDKAVYHFRSPRLRKPRAYNSLGHIIQLM